jgi:hypothetical protein
LCRVPASFSVLERIRRLVDGCLCKNDSFVPLGMLMSDFLPLTSRAGGANPAETTRPSSPNRNCTRIRAVAGLTCLSVRCLSSYLIFSASSSDKQAAARFVGARLG